MAEVDEASFEMESESIGGNRQEDTRSLGDVTTVGVLRSSHVKIRSTSSGRSEQSDYMFAHPDFEDGLNHASPSIPGQDTTGIESTAVNSLSLDNKLDTKGDLWPSRVEFVHVLEQESQVDRDKRILEQLGYSEVLGRDYEFWASFSVGYCAFGGIQAAALNMYTTWVYGGAQ